MRVPRRLAAPAVAGCLALVGAVAAAPAGSTQHRPLPVPDARYCAAVVGHAPGADGYSPVLGRACSPDSLADALARSDGRTRAAEQPADRTLLLEEFKDVGYGGGVSYASTSSTGTRAAATPPATTW
ncbi:hypothetical protein ACFZDG_33590 [Kitasatospora xanthocidica]|uniref:hypothetical protein n=1 Tax=Kitasatospora xanthocidica TaxID=83382 RepID=UPI0036E80899